LCSMIFTSDIDRSRGGRTSAERNVEGRGVSRHKKHKKHKTGGSRSMVPLKRTFLVPHRESSQDPEITPDADDRANRRGGLSAGPRPGRLVLPEVGRLHAWVGRDFRRRPFHHD
jgi:hypothetical protein